MKKTRHTHIKSTKKAFQAVVKEGELLMNFSYGSAEANDEDGNKVKIFIWISGDWHVEYKGREFIVPLNENINALIEWINQGN